VRVPDRQPVDRAGAQKGVDVAAERGVEQEPALDPEAHVILGELVPEADRLALVVLPKHPDPAPGRQAGGESARRDHIVIVVDLAEVGAVALDGAVVAGGLDLKPGLQAGQRHRSLPNRGRGLLVETGHAAADLPPLLVEPGNSGSSSRRPRWASARRSPSTVRHGEAVALLGPSGSGKTTLLNIIGCIIDPTEGRVTLDGELVYDNRWLRGDLRRLRLDKIGFIFQFHNLLPFLNARDNVALVLTLAGRPAAQAQERAAELLDYLEVGDRAGAMPALLSGGEAQRVAIARALANSPRIILADEPTAACGASV
jgi:putative ABC transport system ATP-binding protein